MVFAQNAPQDAQLAQIICTVLLVVMDQFSHLKGSANRDVQKAHITPIKLAQNASNNVLVVSMHRFAQNVFQASN